MAQFLISGPFAVSAVIPECEEIFRQLTKGDAEVMPEGAGSIEDILSLLKAQVGGRA
jgi:hypothetical protein